MKKTIIYIYHENFKIKPYEIEAFFKCNKTYNSITIILSKKFQQTDIRIKKILEKGNIFLIKYSSEYELKKNLEILHKTCDVELLDSFQEESIIEINQLRALFHIPITSHFELFGNKKIQRSLLKNEKNITTLSKEKKTYSLEYESIMNEFGTPFIIKPQKGVESSGVALIKSPRDLDIYKRDFGENTRKILIESYIGGDMYSIDYYVDDAGVFYCSPPIEMYLAQNLGINDFFVYCCKVYKDMSLEINTKKLENFIKKTIHSCGIKNTFVHHEFKQTPNGDLINIEINGRIGGRRLKILSKAYGVEMYDLLFKKRDFLLNKKKYNFAAFAIYPEKQGLLDDYNYEIINKIKKLPSFYELNISPERKNTIIGPTRFGYSNLGMIYLLSKDDEQFQRDYTFIEGSYKNLLLLKETYEASKIIF